MLGKKDSAKKLNNLYTELHDVDNDVRNKNPYNLLVSKVTGENVLDMGSGAGHFLAKLQEKGLKAEGIEPDKCLTNFDKNLYENSLKVHEVNAENIENINKNYDIVTMIDVLEHIKSDVLVLKKLARSSPMGATLRYRKTFTKIQLFRKIEMFKI